MFERDISAVVGVVVIEVDYGGSEIFGVFVELVLLYKNIYESGLQVKRGGRRIILHILLIYVGNKLAKGGTRYCFLVNYRLGNFDKSRHRLAISAAPLQEINAVGQAARVQLQNHCMRRGSCNFSLQDEAAQRVE